jgi:hypothetical protein
VNCVRKGARKLDKNSSLHDRIPTYERSDLSDLRTMLCLTSAGSSPSAFSFPHPTLHSLFFVISQILPAFYNVILYYIINTSTSIY